MKCVAATVCCIYRTSTYHGNLIVPLHATSTDLHVAKVRIGFRLAEYAHGFRSSIPTHEAYQYALDSVPMLYALVILNCVHSGRIMPGARSGFSGRKARKFEGAHTKSQWLKGILG